MVPTETEVKEDDQADLATNYSVPIRVGESSAVISRLNHESATNVAEVQEITMQTQQKRPHTRDNTQMGEQKRRLQKKPMEG